MGKRMLLTRDRISGCGTLHAANELFLAHFLLFKSKLLLLCDLVSKLVGRHASSPPASDFRASLLVCGAGPTRNLLALGSLAWLLASLLSENSGHRSSLFLLGLVI